MVYPARAVASGKHICRLEPHKARTSHGQRINHAPVIFLIYNIGYAPQQYRYSPSRMSYRSG